MHPFLTPLHSFHVLLQDPLRYPDILPKLPLEQDVVHSVMRRLSTLPAGAQRFFEDYVVNLDLHGLASPLSADSLDGLALEPEQPQVPILLFCSLFPSSLLPFPVAFSTAAPPGSLPPPKHPQCRSRT